VAGITVTAGFVWWLTRAGGMLATVLMGVPAWRHIDLLPVLARPDDDDEEDEAPDDEPVLDGMFERQAPGHESGNPP